MLQLEKFYRRVAYSFGLALIVTVGFMESERYFYLPMITWVVAALFFLLSWRIQKEYTSIIVKIDGEDAKPNDPIAWVVGDKLHVYHLLWSAVYTFGTYVVVAIPIDWFVEGTRGWRPIFACSLVVLFIAARLFDKQSRPGYYNKKS